MHIVGSDFSFSKFIHELCLLFSYVATGDLERLYMEMLVGELARELKCKLLFWKWVNNVLYEIQGENDDEKRIVLLVFYFKENKLSS